MTKHVPYTTPVMTLCPENTIHDALFLMRKNDIKRIVIANGNIPVGIVTERDIGKFLQNDKTSRTLDKIPLNEIMSRNLFTISKDQDELIQNGLVGSPCRPRDSQESSPTPQFKSINSSVPSLLHSPTLTSIHDHWKNHSLD